MARGTLPQAVRVLAILRARVGALRAVVRVAREPLLVGLAEASGACKNVGVLGWRCRRVPN
jgi:hypothetical protein